MECGGTAGHGNGFNIEIDAVERQFAHVSRQRSDTQGGGAEKLVRREIERKFQLDVLEVKIAAACVSRLLGVGDLCVKRECQQRKCECAFHIELPEEPGCEEVEAAAPSLKLANPTCSDPAIMLLYCPRCWCHPVGASDSKQEPVLTRPARNTPYGTPTCKLGASISIACGPPERRAGAGQIGRASCRERV